MGGHNSIFSYKAERIIFTEVFIIKIDLLAVLAHVKTYHKFIAPKFLPFINQFAARKFTSPRKNDTKIIASKGFSIENKI